jgi:hypothetical protein
MQQWFKENPFPVDITYHKKFDIRKMNKSKRYIAKTEKMTL